ncbi:MAG TPA: right-handed parallel beta-helix repeat-containing protein [Reyranella sp.]|nr:right-handed parallel beta-helix repeat-containing protein [Reyranella sp.]
MSDVIDKVFAHEGLSKLDKAALVARYDVTQALHAISTPLRAKLGQPQQGFVISSIPPQGILLTTPGTYTFAGPLNWTPPAAPGAAITIVGNGIVLDMMGFALTASVSDLAQIVSGIYVFGSSNVTIRNGTLANMGYLGIGADVVSNLTLDRVTVSGVGFDNLFVRNACPAGIHIDHASQPTLTGCVVQDMNVTSDSSAGIQILNTIGGTVSGCTVSNLVNNDGSVQGYSTIASAGLTTTNCTAENLRTHFNGNVMTLGHTVLGFCPIFCVDLSYSHCTAIGMTGCCDDCHGMSVFLDLGIKVTNFKAQGVTDGVCPEQTGAKATGLEVYGALVAISDCSVQDIKAINPQDLQGTGFSVWGWGISFTDCQAKNVVVVDAKGNKNPAVGYGTGFGWAPDPRPEFRIVGAYSVTYSGCSATDCQVGFDTWFHVGSTWTKVSYTNCDIDILVQPGASRTLSANPCSECNPPLVVAITNIASGNKYPGS